ncbi:hypothetical protein XENTR_v10019224 [Xenopus tropicalis]|uniref:P2X purinoceptor 7 n=2 Tax=Xenopus tropicalis TaxID=8364 RepID=A0A803KG07_XENTR|nr:P2X purinoceptor 7 [Xenopus tropicalis]KAE8593616.1 hypothetical protein XENTR_v10019224 [Xenopus tropicalis]|eukprot:XP_017946115.1 PREDICTED: P2X purinoceptor 7-like [Xenopus tropicalis]
MQSQGHIDPTCFGNEPVRDKPTVRRQSSRTENRVGTNTWCTCGNCMPMKTEEESYCCMELSNKKYLQDGCICHSRKFRRQCLKKTHLEFLLTFWNLQGPTNEISCKNRKLRQTAYRSFIAWIYGYLGRNNRKPIPACVVQKVRNTFPDPEGRYRGFLRPFDFNAFDMALG